MRHDEAGVSCKPCSPCEPVGAVQLADPAKLMAHNTHLTGEGRFSTYIQRGKALVWFVLAASLAGAQLRAA